MPTLLDKVPSLKKRDQFTCLPEELIADESKNGRAFPHSDEAIKRRAESMLKHGQKTPVKVRQVTLDDGGKALELAHGYLRYLAACYINKHGLADEPFRLRFEKENLNDEGTFIDNVVENLDNEVVTAVDHAYNQQRLRDRFDKSDKEIAELYNMPASTISQLKKILVLPAKIQRAVHEGKFAWTVAIGLADMPEDKALEEFEKAKKQDGSVSTATIKEATRAQRNKSGKGLTRSARDIRKFVDAQIVKHTEDEGNADSDPKLVDFMSSLRDYVDGKKGEQAFINAINRLRETE